MFLILVEVADILATGLLTGAMFYVWLTDTPQQMTASFYTQLQHNRVGITSTVLPRLGGLTVILTVIMAVSLRQNMAQVAALAVALLCQLGSAAATAFGNMPINRQNLTWQADNPPTDWLATARRWSAWHRLRIALMLVAFILLTVTALLPSP